MYKYFKQDEITGLDTELVEMLDKAREVAGIPFIITSGLRSEIKNCEVGGVMDSAHCKGLAVDLSCKTSDARFLIIKGLLVAGFNRIGLYTTHIHTDIDKTKPQNIIYLY
jgi:zinc D-Ala-D-Ala carboxypeptidase